MEGEYVNLRNKTNFWHDFQPILYQMYALSRKVGLL